MSDTPETDAVYKYWPSENAELVDADFARKLERERDEARQKAEKSKETNAQLKRERDEAREAFVIATDQMVIAQGKVREANKERDEALNTNFEEISNKLVVAISERDEARGRAKELSELVDGAYILVELDKPQSEYNKKWRESWLEKAKRLIPGVDSIWY